MYNDGQFRSLPKFCSLSSYPFHGRRGRQTKNKKQWNYMEQFITCLREQGKNESVVPHPANILQLHQAPLERKIKEA
uniref:Uncharacterized protein n=1 Tax=Arundo donax TaxID=35708 RepID=A0A0A9D380_ARUDO